MNILITGGASGLGEAITKALAANNSDNIFFTFNKSADKAASLEKEFPNAKGIQCDFLNQESIKNLLEFIDTANLDVLVNNAYSTGIDAKHFHKVDASVFLNNFQANIIPTIRITQKVISGFRKKKSGKIINILSSAIVGNPPNGWSEYTAGKAYLESLSKSWAVENIAFNVTSNSISPSFMLTNLTSDTDERSVELIKDSNPLKQLLKTAEVAEAVLFFTKCSSQVNGVNLIINAGTSVI
jgi:NAD(P)-dependent dehydrogenase (short-subunit alcohol dehydrogenase family)